jgi:hypothetical protein
VAPGGVNDDAEDNLPVEAGNVARLYRQLAVDLRDRTGVGPTFRAAEALHALIEQVPPPH